MPRALDDEQDDQDDDGDRLDVRAEDGRRDLETLDRAEHRDRRRDHAVAVEQRRAEEAEGDEDGAARSTATRACATSAISARMPPSPRLSARMTKTRYLSEMTMISDQKISESTPRTFSGVAATPCVHVKALAQRVERAGADVAVDDAERAQREDERDTVRCSSRSGEPSIGRAKVTQAGKERGGEEWPTPTSRMGNARCRFHILLTRTRTSDSQPFYTFQKRFRENIKSDRNHLNLRGTKQGAYSPFFVFCAKQKGK